MEKKKDIKEIIKYIVTNSLDHGTVREDLEEYINDITFIGYLDDQIYIHLSNGVIYTIEIEVRKI